MDVMREYVCSLIGINSSLSCVFDGEDIVATAAFIFNKGERYRVYRSDDREMIEHIVVQTDGEVLVASDVFNQQFMIEPDPPKGYAYITKDIMTEGCPELIVYNVKEGKIEDLPPEITKDGEPGEFALIDRVHLPKGDSELARRVRERYQRAKFAAAKEDLCLRFISDQSEVRLVINIHKNQVFQIVLSEENALTFEIGNTSVSAPAVWAMKHFQVLPQCLYGYQYIGTNPLYNPSCPSWRMYNMLQQRFMTEDEELNADWINDKAEWVMVRKVAE